jgi:hypothetical protein
MNKIEASKATQANTTSNLAQPANGCTDGVVPSKPSPTVWLAKPGAATAP